MIQARNKNKKLFLKSNSEYLLDNSVISILKIRQIYRQVIKADINFYLDTSKWTLSILNMVLLCLFDMFC